MPSLFLSLCLHSSSLPFTSNKRAASLSLCLLGSDNRTCPEPREMNYLPHSLLNSWKKIKSLFLYYHWTHNPCITCMSCSVALDVKRSEKLCFSYLQIRPLLAAACMCMHTNTPLTCTLSTHYTPRCSSRWRSKGTENNTRLRVGCCGLSVFR